MSSDKVFAKLETFLEWLVQHHKLTDAQPPADPRLAELHQLLEASLIAAPVRPHSGSHKFSPREPLTEQQKVMDLAG
jgi:hypothetical protein